ncbi:MULTISPECIES: hypothetical protein [Pseudoalteromonas]|uniref:hypothetical protein n=1 Tax=Pseudoalteromonas TaxID=53246 RepID=UPI00035C30DD|nr:MULTISPECIES: hypothetical protein [Pseudoalteromonas]
MGKANIGSVSDLLVVALNAVLAGCAIAAYKNWKKDKVVENVRELISDAYIIYHSSRQFYNTLYCYYIDSSSIQINLEDATPEKVSQTLTEQYDELLSAYNKLSKNIDILCYFYPNDDEKLFNIRLHATSIMNQVTEDRLGRHRGSYDKNILSLFEEIKSNSKNRVILDLIATGNIFQLKDPNKRFSLSDFKDNFTSSTKSIFKI